MRRHSMVRPTERKEIGLAQRNVLWIMCDQLRFDYLGCSGHQRIRTPNIDGLAAKGVRFTNAYVNSPICGPSRMCYYTGRYARSHGSTFQGIPLRVGEPTLGVHLNEIGVRNVLVGKTHMTADLEGLRRLGIDPNSMIGVRESECGFEPYVRDDGIVPKADPKNPTHYNSFLTKKGYAGENPWEEYANSGEEPGGKLRSGWFLEYSNRAARIEEPDSETPYMTDRAIEFMSEAKKDQQSWCLHLSYIKPHWPYIAPAPYHNMYGTGDVQPPVRSGVELDDPNPIYKAYMEERVSRAFVDEKVRERVIPAYMGLVTQIDDQIGRIVAFLEEEGIAQDTMIVFSSDHGDYLGDHWLGEKELFHNPSVKVPLIIYDPTPEAEANRGKTCDALVEAIDLAPTFLEYFGAEPPDHILEGRSLIGFVEGREVVDWRRHVFSEMDYAMREPRLRLGKSVKDSRMVMVHDGRWKYIYTQDLPPMLFDLENDPNEFLDLGRDPSYAETRVRLHEAMTQWALKHHTRITITDAVLESRTSDDLEKNILIGFWDEDELDDAHRES